MSAANYHLIVGGEFFDRFAELLILNFPTMKIVEQDCTALSHCFAS